MADPRLIFYSIPPVCAGGFLFLFFHSAKFPKQGTEKAGRADEYDLHTVLPRGRKRSFLTVGHLRRRAAIPAARIPIASRTVRTAGGRNRVRRIPSANARDATVIGDALRLQHFISAPSSRLQDMRDRAGRCAFLTIVRAQARAILRGRRRRRHIALRRGQHIAPRSARHIAFSRSRKHIAISVPSPMFPPCATLPACAHDPPHVFSSRPLDKSVFSCYTTFGDIKTISK